MPLKFGSGLAGRLSNSWDSFLGCVKGLTVLPGVSELALSSPGKPLLNFRPEVKQDYPPNLSILIRGGKENNCDALSNGE